MGEVDIARTAPARAGRPTPIKAPGLPFSWRGRALEAVPSVGELSNGLVWIVGPGRVPIATVRRGELVPTGYEPMSGDDRADLEKRVRAAMRSGGST